MRLEQVKRLRAQACLAANNAWRLAIASLSGNATLCEMLTTLYQKMGRYALLYWTLAPNHKPTVAEHRAVAEALAEGDNRRAARALKAHLDSALARITGALRERLSDEPTALRD